MTEQRMQYCKHFYFFANQGISGCAKCHQHCYYTNCPDWEPVTVSYTVTTTTTNEKVREESWIKAGEEEKWILSGLNSISFGDLCFS